MTPCSYVQQVTVSASPVVKEPSGALEAQKFYKRDKLYKFGNTSFTAKRAYELAS